jgi:hypothetical protein
MKKYRFGDGISAGVTVQGLVALSASRLLRSKCPNVVDVLDWVCLAPRPQTALQGLVAMPSPPRLLQQLPQRQALPYLGDRVSGAMSIQTRRGGRAEK